MPTIVIETAIAAARERCFDLARDVRVHCATASFSAERVVAPGRLEGLLEEGDLVTFEGVHFAIRQRLTAHVTELRRPDRFVDEQLRGPFSALRHIHEFEATVDGTLMRDTLTWTAPFGLIGRLANPFLAHHLRSFVIRKQQNLRLIAERG